MLRVHNDERARESGNASPADRGGVGEADGRKVAGGGVALVTIELSVEAVAGDLGEVRGIAEGKARRKSKSCSPDLCWLTRLAKLCTILVRARVALRLRSN